jgi:hypothetical protein
MIGDCGQPGAMMTTTADGRQHRVHGVERFGQLDSKAAS